MVLAVDTCFNDNLAVTLDHDRHIKVYVANGFRHEQALVGFRKLKLHCGGHEPPPGRSVSTNRSNAGQDALSPILAFFDLNSDLDIAIFVLECGNPSLKRFTPSLGCIQKCRHCNCREQYSDADCPSHG